MRSARLGLVRNGTSDLLSMAPDISSALTNLSIVLSATMSVWEKTSVSDVSSPAMSLTLTGASIIVLRARRRTFMPGFTATLGYGACLMGPSSDDGAWLALVTPDTQATCGINQSSSAALASDCGYVRFVLNSSSSNSLDRGVALSCPPFCAGSMRVPSFVLLPDGLGSFVPGSLPAAGSGVPPQALEHGLSDSSTGFYYAAACSAAGAYAEVPVLRMMPCLLLFHVRCFIGQDSSPVFDFTQHNMFIFSLLHF